MGNYRFRFSDMMPNAWFYKLKDMSSKNKMQKPVVKGKKQQKKSAAEKNSHHKPRYSYYLTSPEPIKPGEFIYNSPVNRKASDTHFPDASSISSSRRSSTSRRNNYSRRRTVYKPSPRHFYSSSSVSSAAAGCTCQDHHNHHHQAKFFQSPDYFVSSDSESSSLDPDDQSPLYYSEEEEEDDHDDDFVDPDPEEEVSWPDSCNCEVTSSTTDIIIDINSNETFTQRIKKLSGFDQIAKLELEQLPPILTKKEPVKFQDMSSKAAATKHIRTGNSGQVKAHHHHQHQSLSVKIVQEESVRTQKDHQRTLTSPVVRKPSSKTGIKLRANSPKIASKKIQAYSRKSFSSNNYVKTPPKKRSLSESFIVVKSSIDPQKDFRDSMEEMIMENNIRNSKELEDLLACYLSLNSNEYHDLIVKAFEQIWFDLTNLRL